MVNPNFPNITARLGTSNPYFGGAAPHYTELAKRLLNQWGTGRGRQYELDQMQSGSWRGTWRNDDGALDPDNSGSPYAGLLLPYRAFGVQAQWPPTANLLTADQATGGEGTPLSPATLGSVAGVSWTGPTAASGPQVSASGTAYQGTQVWQHTMLAAAVIGQCPFLIRVPVAPGMPYTLTIPARCVTNAVNPSVNASITWYNAAGGIISTTSGSNHTLTGGAAPSWTPCTVSIAGAPAAAVEGLVALTLAANLTALTSFQVDGLQFECSAAASAFVTPGTWYPMWTGLIERYPQTWKNRGAYGLVSPIGVDALAPLSQVTLTDPLTASAFTPAGGTSPSLAYMLNDPNGSTTFTDSTGSYASAPLLASKFGAGTVTPGVTQTAATTAGLFVGSAQTVTTFGGPTAAGTNAYGHAMSAINLSGGSSGALGSHAGVPGPAAGTGLGFTRMIAFRCTQLPSNTSALWWASGGPVANGNVISMQLSSTLAFVVNVNDASHGTGSSVGTYDVGNWHLGWVGVNAAGTLYIGGVDSTVGTYAVAGAAYNPSANGGFAQDLLGAAPFGNANSSDFASMTFNFVGDLCMAIEWPFFMNSTQTTAIYNAWKSAFSGDTSGQRYSRILGWAGYTGPTAIDTGSSTSLGPATDVTGKSALSALQDVIDTEDGSHFVDAAGTLRFYSRARRYLATTPAVTFGESVGTGESPYEDFATDYDPTRVANVVQITQTSTGQVFTAADTTSFPNYGNRPLARNNQSTSAPECADAAAYLLSRYKTPRTRLQKLRLHPGANASLWASLLALELGARIRAMRRPPAGAAAIQIDGFTEQINWTVSDKPDATVDLQVSPADLSPYGVFTSLHAALKNSASAGAGTIVLKPLSDSATNPAAANLTSGQQLVLDLGLGTQETVTIATGGVQATSPGYTSVTLTLTAALTQNHAANAVVCEPMPAGVTDPTTYDGSAVFGSVQFAY